MSEIPTEKVKKRIREKIKLGRGPALRDIKDLAEARRTEERVKRKLLTEQLKAANTVFTMLDRIKSDLNNAGLRLFKMTDYVFIPEDKRKIIETRREIEARRESLDTLHRKWSKLIHELESKLRK